MEWRSCWIVGSTFQVLLSYPGGERRQGEVRLEKIDTVNKRLGKNLRSWKIHEWLGFFVNARTAYTVFPVRGYWKLRMGQFRGICGRRVLMNGYLVSVYLRKHVCLHFVDEAVEKSCLEVMRRLLMSTRCGLFEVFVGRGVYGDNVRALRRRILK